jgi:RNA-directed DNA polymerase
MKREGDLFERVTSFEALIEATRRAARAGGSGLTLDAARFVSDLEVRCLSLRHTLLNGDYQPGAYRTFMIHKPKPRLISASPFVDRVVHHSLCAVLEPHFERFAVYDSYACRRGKGLHLAMDRAQRMTRRFSVYLKLDIKHYFETVSHEILKALLRRRFKDPHVLSLCDRIIDHGAPGSPAGLGLPIGNLTSQHFANVYLSALDRFIKQDLRVKGYLRYMDDFILFADDFATLRGWRDDVRDFALKSLKLTLKDRAERLDWVSSGVPFLGVRIFRSERRFDRGRKRRLRARLHHLSRLESDEVNEAVVARHASLRSWARVADSDGLLSSWQRRWGLPLDER